MASGCVPGSGGSGRRRAGSGGKKQFDQIHS